MMLEVKMIIDVVEIWDILIFANNDISTWQLKGPLLRITYNNNKNSNNNNIINLAIERPRFSNRLPANGGKWTLGRMFINYQ